MKLRNYIEFESKYRLDLKNHFKWKEIVSNIEGLKEFVYAESDDIYYTKNNQDYEFIRYRFSNTTKEKRAELTIKKKTNENNNIKRFEKNLRVDYNSKDTVESFVESLGFKKNFRIKKPGVHIYRFKDATLPLYTVIDEKENIDHFIEIEINEDLISQITEQEAWDIIKKYEDYLKPLGISPQNRMKLSLFEIYRKEKI